MSRDLILTGLCMAFYIEAGRARLDAVMLTRMLSAGPSWDGKDSGVQLAASDLSRSERRAHSAAALTYILLWPFVSIIAGLTRARR